MTTEIKNGTGPNGQRYIYTIGCTEHGLPELILLYDVPTDDAADPFGPVVEGAEASVVAAQLLAALTGHQIERRTPFADGEIVSLLGVRFRLHAVADLTGCTLIEAERRYGVGGFAVMQATVDA